MAAKKVSPKKESSPRGDAVGMLRILILQFVLGMIVNLYGSPPDASGHLTEPLLVTILFGLHGLLGIGLLIGSIVVFVKARKSSNTLWRQTALWGLISILVAAVAGLAVVALGENDLAELASLVMSLGFIAAFISYGRYFLAKKD